MIQVAARHIRCLDNSLYRTRGKVKWNIIIMIMI